MAATLINANDMEFGVTTTLTNMKINSCSWTEEAQVAEVQDEDGDFVAAAIFGQKITGKLSGIYAGAVAAIGTTVTLAGFPTGQYYVTGKSGGQTNTGFQTVDVDVTAWGGITA